jgi:hypothetical protein
MLGRMPFFFEKDQARAVITKVARSGSFAIGIVAGPAKD